MRQDHVLWVFRTVQPLHHSQGAQITYHWEKNPQKPTEFIAHKITLFRRQPVFLPYADSKTSEVAPRITYIPIVNAQALVHILREAILVQLLRTLDLSVEALTQTATGKVAYHTLLSGGGLSGSTTASGAGAFPETADNQRIVDDAAPFFLFGGSYGGAIWHSSVSIGNAWPFVPELPAWEDFLRRIAPRPALAERYRPYWIRVSNPEDWKAWTLFPTAPRSKPRPRVLANAPANANAPGAAASDPTSSDSADANPSSSQPASANAEHWSANDLEEAMRHAFISYRHISQRYVPTEDNSIRNMPVALEIVPANAVFGTEIGWARNQMPGDNTPWLMRAFLQLGLNALADGFLLGARGARGFGRCTTLDVPEFVPDLTPLFTWIRTNAPVLRTALTGTISDADRAAIEADAHTSWRQLAIKNPGKAGFLTLLSQFHQLQLIHPPILPQED